MMEDGPRFPSFTTWQRLIRAVLVVFFILHSARDLGYVATGIWGLVSLGILPSGQFVFSLLSLFARFTFLAVCYLALIFGFAQFILPVTGWQDRCKAAWQLFLFGISFGRWHGAAVFVRDGEMDMFQVELEKNGPGIAFVDLRSAITLDKQLKYKNDLLPASLEQPQKAHFDPKTKTFVSGIRVVGPGLTFLKRKEKIAGRVDLRSQNRARKSVHADTRDGIRIVTDVSCTFTIGQPPDILDVCLGGEDGRQVFVIEWETSLPVVFKKIKSLIPRNLDPGDEREILEFIAKHPDPSGVVTDVPETHFPYSFHEKRVEKAVYSQTSIKDPTGSHGQFKKWSDWPQDVAAEKFRIILAQWPYMKLYSPQDIKNYPLKDFKKELSRQVRNTGILAYRVATLRNGGKLQEGRVYSINELIYYPPRELTRMDVLRYRGIKVLNVGIGELEPKEKTVRDHQVDSWLSSKQKEADVKSADYNLEIARIRNQARVKTQQSMIYHLTQLLENQEYPREALALLIYQELEATAANPETRKLLPADTMSLLTGIGTMLLPPDRNSTRPTGGMPVIAPNGSESNE